jgi:hypothetical protein
MPSSTFTKLAPLNRVQAGLLVLSAPDYRHLGYHFRTKLARQVSKWEKSTWWMQDIKKSILALRLIWFLWIFDFALLAHLVLPALFSRKM